MQTNIFSLPEWSLFNHHIGVGLREIATGGGDLDASDVANLVTHALLPLSSRTQNQSPLTSRIVKGVPFFTLPITL
jgi:hypothetical protein